MAGPLGRCPDGALWTLAEQKREGWVDGRPVALSDPIPLPAVLVRIAQIGRPRMWLAATVRGCGDDGLAGRRGDGLQEATLRHHTRRNFRSRVTIGSGVAGSRIGWSLEEGQLAGLDPRAGRPGQRFHEAQRNALLPQDWCPNESNEVQTS